MVGILITMSVILNITRNCFVVSKKECETDSDRRWSGFISRLSVCIICVSISSSLSKLWDFSVDWNRHRERIFELNGGSIFQTKEKLCRDIFSELYWHWSCSNVTASQLEYWVTKIIHIYWLYKYCLKPLWYLL